MKKQIKRSLALVMTVFMLLSCWVFVAPEKAEAVDSGKYTITLWAWVGDEANGCNNKLTVKYKLTNGKGGEGTQEFNLNGLLNNGKGDKEATYTCKGFPTSITFRTERSSGSPNVININISKVKIGTEEVVKDTYTVDTTAWWSPREITWSGWDYPYAKTGTFTDMGALELDTSTDGTTTSTTFYATDQYGVKMGTNYTASVKIGTNTNSNLTVAKTSGTNADTFTVTGKKALRITSDYWQTGTLTVTVPGSTNKSFSKTFTIYNPKYTQTYNANGGSLGNPTSYDVYYGRTMAQQSTIDSNKKTYPTSGTKEGYTFKGMYGSKLADSYVYALSWSEPSATKLGDDTKVTANKTWYAAWWANNHTATFIDYEGKTVATATGKYDKTLPAGNSDAYNALPQPEYHKRPGETGTFDYNFAGWEVYKAEDASGNDITDSMAGQDIGEAVLKGNITFRAKYALAKHNYTIRFLDNNGDEIAANSRSDYKYNEHIVQPGDLTKANDPTYTYEFLGWTKISGADRGEFIVNENGYTDGGEYVPVSAIDKVLTDATYAPVYKKVYIPYTVSFTYDGVTNKTVYENKHYGDTIEIPTPQESYTKDGYRYVFAGTWDRTPDTSVKGNISYTAQYDEPIPAIYTIKFFDYDGTTELNPLNNQFAHGTTVSAPAPTREYRQNGKQYTWSGAWKSADGVWFTGGTPASADGEYFPVYADADLYNVNYYNGDQYLGSEQQVAGKAVPAFSGDTPTKEDDLYANNYRFTGWADENGNKVTTMGASDLNLYAQFDSDVIDYTVKFLKDDGTDMIAPQIVHYGDTITVPTNEQAAKAPDATYNYTFKGWDSDVNETCAGDATYTATYRRAYNYYTIKWLDENDNVFKQENYIYNERINAPYTQPETAKQPSNENYEMVFDSWKKVDAAGNLTDTKYVRGDRVTGSATYKATYIETGKSCNVTFLDDDGTTVLQTVKVAYGTKLGEIAAVTPMKPSTDDSHYNFIGWKDANSDTLVTEKETSYVAQYEAEAHSFAVDEVKTAPTFFENGVGTERCSCGVTKDTVIDKLTDGVAPTGKIYVKDHTWVTGDTADFSTPIPAAPSNNLIINATDAGDVNAQFNKDGKLGSGVAKIEYSIQNGEKDVEAISESDWTVRFDYNETERILKENAEKEAAGDAAILAAKLKEVEEYLANLKANASGTLGDDAAYADGTPLEDGSIFVLYGRITDRLGNVSYLNSGLMVYDNIQPEVSVTSDWHFESKHCVKALISASDQGQIDSVTLNNKAITLDENGEYLVEAEGIYQVVVRDAAGNESKANFEVVGKHNIKPIPIPATCINDGEQYDKCLLCQQKFNVKTIPATGKHTYDSGFVTKKATCIDNGERTYTCEICGNIKTEVIPMLSENGHDYVVQQRVESTCSKKGFETSICRICNDVKTEELELNPDAHKYYYPETTKATCTEPGKVTETCRYCGDVHEIKVLPATGHTASGTWVTVTEPDCYNPGLEVQYCAAGCKETITDESGNPVEKPVVVEEREIAKLDHNFKLVETVAPTETAQGYTLYKCARCGLEDKRDYVEYVPDYTVTFKDESGNAFENGVITKKMGETLTSFEAPTVPEKPANETYKYSFAGWVDESGNAVTLPLTIDGDITLTVKYNQRYVNYAISLVKDDAESTHIRKIGYLHNGEQVNLPEAPEKASDGMYDYAYVGWKLKGAEDETAATTWTIVAADVTLVPVYKGVLRKYNVVFAYSPDNIISTIKDVDAGEDVVYTGETPVKAADDSQHYKFIGWSKETTNIQSNLFVTAQFEAEKHTYTTNTIAPTCTESGKIIRSCVCGKSKESTLAPIGHDLSGTPFIDENGVLVKHCPRCGVNIPDETKYTVTFLNDDGKILKTVGFVTYGTDITANVPVATKAETASKRFVFKHWVDEDGNVVTIDETHPLIVTADAKYTAVYDEEDKTYTVIYAIDADHVLQVVKNVEGGTLLPKYTGETPTKSDSNVYGHLVFDGWSRGEETVVTEDLYVTAKFKRVEHTNIDVESEADCVNGSGIKHTCKDCGFSYVEETGKPLGHKWQLIEAVEPTFSSPGYEKYLCERCGETMTKDFEQKQMITISITILARDGQPVSGAKVSLYDVNKLVAQGTTGANGTVVLKVPEAKDYTIFIEGDEFDSITSTIKVNPDGTVDTSTVPVINIERCTCPCHRNGMWGSLFRFFHKIIKLITGEFKCCNNPDHRYFN